MLVHRGVLQDIRGREAVQNVLASVIAFRGEKRQIFTRACSRELRSVLLPGNMSDAPSGALIIFD